LESSCLTPHTKGVAHRLLAPTLVIRNSMPDFKKACAGSATWKEGISPSRSVSAGGMYERLRVLAADLIRSKVDIVVAGSTLSVQAARSGDVRDSLVMAAVPIRRRGVCREACAAGRKSLPACQHRTEVSAKHLECVRAVVPKLSRVAVLVNPPQSKRFTDSRANSRRRVCRWLKSSPHVEKRAQRRRSRLPSPR
jgi:hypothetical protein